MLLTEVQIDSDRCTDRVVFSFRPAAGQQPGYTVEYRTAAEAQTEDASGKHIPIAGNAFLVVRLEPAATADLSGAQLEVHVHRTDRIKPSGMRLSGDREDRRLRGRADLGDRALRGAAVHRDELRLAREPDDRDRLNSSAHWWASSSRGLGRMRAAELAACAAGRPRAGRGGSRRRQSGGSSRPTASGTSGRRAARRRALPRRRGPRLEAVRGSLRASDVSYHAPQTTSLTVLGQGSARLTATPHSTITSARTSGTSGSSSRWRRIAVAPPNGRFATTRNGSLGSPAACVALDDVDVRPPPTQPPRERGSSSTASTRHATAASSAVSRPLPAPRSRTRSSGPTPESRTSSAASACGEGNAGYARGPAGAQLVRAARTRTITVVIATES